MLAVPSVSKCSILSPRLMRVKNHALFIMPVLWNDNCNGLANGLFCRVIEETLRAPIPACDDAIEVLAYDCIVTGLDDRCQKTQSFVTFAKRSFGPLAISNVDPRGMQEHHCPRRVPNGVHRKVYDTFAAVGYPVSKLLAKNEPRSSLIRSKTYPRLHLF